MNDDLWLWLDLFWRFMLVSLLAFGGGQAALPLVERVAVKEQGWVNEQDFAAAVGCGYVTPGPVLITATFIGYRAGGLAGATAATLGVFLLPWFLAAATARLLRDFLQRPWLRRFGAGAGPAVVGLPGPDSLRSRPARLHWMGLRGRCPARSRPVGADKGSPGLHPDRRGRGRGGGRLDVTKK